MPVLNHIHKYVRRETGLRKYPIYRCILPDCSHFINEVLIEGRKSLCYFCETEFIINKKMVSLKTQKLHCGCKNIGKKRKIGPTITNDDIRDLLKKVGVS